MTISILQNDGKKNVWSKEEPIIQSMLLDLQKNGDSALDGARMASSFSNPKCSAET